MKILKLKDIIPQKLQDRSVPRAGVCMKFRFPSYTLVRVHLIYYYEGEVYLYRITKRVKRLSE